MLHPSYTDLMRVMNSEVENGEEPTVNSRYSIVIAASKRARQLIDKQNKKEEKIECYKPLSAAVSELEEGIARIIGEDDLPEDEIVLKNELYAEKKQDMTDSAYEEDDELLEVSEEIEE